MKKNNVAMKFFFLEYLASVLFFEVISQVIPPEPEFIGEIPKLTVSAGKDAALKCVVKNLGHYKVTWLRVETNQLLSIDGNVFYENGRIGVTSPNKNTWYLHLRNVVPEDSGYYMCQINTTPMLSQAGYLDVVVPPEFSTNMSTEVTVNENSNVTLSCKATGHPPPTIVWQREDGQPFIIDGQKYRKYKSEELVIAGVTRYHMAPYLCVASNDVERQISRRIYLDVRFPPLIYIQNQVVGAAESTDVTLECHTEAHPPSANYWKKGNASIAKNERYEPYISRQSYKVHMKLTIKKLQPEDYGNYRCVARNDIIEAEGSITLHHLKLPVVETQNVYTEEIITRPPRKTVTEAIEIFVVTAELERREKSNNIPGKQQKYGEEAAISKVKNCAQVSASLLWISFILSMRTALFRLHR